MSRRAGARASTPAAARAASTRQPVGERLRSVAADAVPLLLAHGYDGFHMADLAAALGLTEAALYRYVEGKDALVHAAFLVCLFPDRATELTAPLADPGRKATIALVEQFLQDASPLPALVRRLRARAAPRDPAGELGDLLRSLYRSLSAHRDALRLIERLGPEWPALHAVWQRARGEFFTALASFLRRRAGQGVHRLVDPPTAAAVIVETVFHFAVARHYERHPAPVNEARVEDSVVTMLTASLL